MATTAATTVAIADALHLARAAGFPADQLVTAVAVAKAESGLNPRAKNDNPATGDYSIGLWQINMLAHKTRYGTELQLMHPGTNARAAHQIWKDRSGGSWAPWGAYTNGSYRTHMADVARVATSGAGTAGAAFQGIEIGPEDIPIIGPAIEDVGDIAGGAGGVIRDVFNLDDLFSQALVVGMQIVFSTVALALIALGLFRLTGTDAGDLFKAGSKAAGGAGAIKAVL